MGTLQRAQTAIENPPSEVLSPQEEGIIKEDARLMQNFLDRDAALRKESTAFDGGLVEELRKAGWKAAQ